MLLAVEFIEWFFLFFKPFWPLCIILGAIAVFAIVYDIKKYKSSSYYSVTKNNYFSVWFDKGRLGEYQIYKLLRKLEHNNARFLFNVYIPKENGETTEIDVLLITEKGIFVFESKNYSGWIFGSENQKYWTQTLPQGRGKSHNERFFNPVIQNAGHIKHLKNIVGEDIAMHSIIAFSERCTLKKIDIKSEVKVVNRDNVPQAVADIMTTAQSELLSNEKIQEIYDKLYVFTQVDTAIKEQHIENINSKISVAFKNQPIVELAEENSKCPRCGGDLVLRVSKKGENAGKSFYGCSNFPKCRYMENIEKVE